jgi:tripartite-type tricarboxylate transporter receptor subunit TctC
MLILRFLLGMLSVVLMVLRTNVVSGQDYPNKLIRIITLSVGGGSDFTTRIVAQGITGPLGQPVIVDNRATGLIASEAVAKAPPDGYTMLIIGSSLWVLPLLQKVPFDTARDFSPVSLIEREVSVLAVHPSVPANSVKQLIALAKARPGELNDASGSSGGLPHLTMELFKSMTGVNIVRVPYRGTAPRLTGLISGEMQLGFFDAALMVPNVKLGKLRALAVASVQPSALFPTLPTIAASGLPGFEATGMTGIWAPAKTPEAVINRLNREIVRMLNLPDVREKFLNAGVEAVGTSPEQFASAVKIDTARWGKVIKDAGIKLD